MSEPHHLHPAPFSFDPLKKKVYLVWLLDKFVFRDLLGVGSLKLVSLRQFPLSLAAL